jgi:hypothetical protein
MLNIFRGFTTTTKNDKAIKKILKYQQKIKNLIIENNLPMTGYTYSYSFNNKKFEHFLPVHFEPVKSIKNP